MAKKLSELLAVNKNLEMQAEKTRAELMDTFSKKRHHFTEQLITFASNTEGVEPVTEKQLDLQTTVKKELAWIKPFLTKSIDSQYQVAVTNTVAKADIVLEDGKTLVKDVPATSLLELEKRMIEIHLFALQIPTLDPAKGFAPDPNRDSDVQKARDEVKTRTQKIQRPLELAKATDKHPAQVQLISEDVPIGKITTREWSGMVTVKEKGEILERIEMLTRAVKRARSRANDTEVQAAASDVKIGDALVGFAFGL